VSRVSIDPLSVSWCVGSFVRRRSVIASRAGERNAVLGILRTFPVPPSPTSTSLKVGMLPAAASAMVVVGLLRWRGCCGIWRTGYRGSC
jgi:hypothetical protein